MSARSNGLPLWKVRPIIDGVIQEDESKPVVGSIVEAMGYANALHLKTGVMHAVREVGK